MKEEFRNQSRRRYQSMRNYRADIISFVCFATILFFLLAMSLYQVGLYLAGVIQ